MLNRMKFRHGMMGPQMDPRSRFFMALASDQRLRVLDLINEGEKSSAELAAALKLDPSVVSRHMMMLRNVGLVNARKSRVTLFFSIADPRIHQIVNLASDIIKDWFDHNRQFFQF